MLLLYAPSRVVDPTSKQLLVNDDASPFRQSKCFVYVGECRTANKRQLHASNFTTAGVLSVQVNVELLTIDKRTFITDEGHSLQTLFGENSEGSAQYRTEVTTVAARLATAFASLKVG